MSREARARTWPHGRYGRKPGSWCSSMAVCVGVRGCAWVPRPHRLAPRPNAVAAPKALLKLRPAASGYHPDGRLPKFVCVGVPARAERDISSPIVCKQLDPTERIPADPDEGGGGGGGGQRDRAVTASRRAGRTHRDARPAFPIAAASSPTTPPDPAAIAAIISSEPDGSPKAQTHSGAPGPCRRATPVLLSRARSPRRRPW